MAIEDDRAAGDLLEALGQLAKLGAAQELVLVQLDERHGNAQQNFGAFIEEAVPYSKDRLDGQDFGEEANEPLGGDDRPRQLQIRHEPVHFGRFESNQLAHDGDIGNESPHIVGVIAGQDVPN